MTYRNISVDFANMAYLFDIANYSLQARISDICMDNDTQSVMYWENASILQDNFIYNEPPSWCYNLRSCYGQKSIDIKECEKAIENFEIDLVHRPLNGWSLKGIIIALQGSGEQNTTLIEYYT